MINFTCRRSITSARSPRFPPREGPLTGRCVSNSIAPLTGRCVFHSIAPLTGRCVFNSYVFPGTRSHFPNDRSFSIETLRLFHNLVRDGVGVGPT